MNRSLLYRVVPHNGGVVIAHEARARSIAAAHLAISRSKTWRALQAAMPPSEFAIVVNNMRMVGEEVPNPDSDFDPEQLPGWADGDYPAWLQKEMDAFLSHEEWAFLATLRSTHLNGSYWHVEPETLVELRRVLESRGYTLTEASELKFW